MKQPDLYDKLLTLAEDSKVDDKINFEVYFKTLQLVLQNKFFEKGFNNILIEIEPKVETISVSIWNPSSMSKVDGYLLYCSFSETRRINLTSIVDFFNDFIQEEEKKPFMSLSLKELEKEHNIKLNYYEE